MVSNARALAGIIGHPLEHTLSPIMHNAAFKALDLPWFYAPLPVKPPHLESALRWFVDQGFRGFNVTIPHKERVINLLHEVSGDAQRIAAVNTISVRNGRLFGENTDWQGFLNDLEDIGFRPDARRALLLGSGGAARGVAYALVTRGCSLLIAARNVATMGSLVGHLRECFPGASIDGMPAGALGDVKDSIDLVVNSTPLGMYPNVDDTPWPEVAPFPRCSLVYDLVYNPPVTRFMRQARREGIMAANGLGMLIHQAALAFTIWTGRAAPIEVMRKTALRG